MKSRLDQALSLMQRGCSIIPVRPDKKPLIKWTQHQLEKADDQQIRDWWSKWPDANIGVVTGAISNFLVVDVDMEKTKGLIMTYFLIRKILDEIVEMWGGEVSTCQHNVERQGSIARAAAN